MQSLHSCSTMNYPVLQMRPSILSTQLMSSLAMFQQTTPLGGVVHDQRMFDSPSHHPTSSLYSNGDPTTQYYDYVQWQSLASRSAPVYGASAGARGRPAVAALQQLRAGTRRSAPPFRCVFVGVGAEKAAETEMHLSILRQWRQFKSDEPQRPTGEEETRVPLP